MDRPTSVDAAGKNLMVKYRHVEIEGVRIFYREAGPENAPVVLLPHSYPSSSFQFRNFMPALADRWRLIAPDYPGFGYSDTPDPSRFAYTFDGYADLLEQFTAALNLTRYALYLHDYGSQIGLRLAMRRPERIAALIIQNGDIYQGRPISMKSWRWCETSSDGCMGRFKEIDLPSCRFGDQINRARVEPVEPVRKLRLLTLTQKEI